MKINQHNYRQFMAEYLSGELSDTQILQMAAFLDKHPHIMAEAADLSEIKLVPGMASAAKDKLYKNIIPYKNIDESNYERFMAAAMEGDLDKTEQDHVNTFLAQNTCLQPEQQQMNRCRLESPALLYPAKTALKHPVPMYQKTWPYAAAAILVIALSLALFRPTGTVLQASATHRVPVNGHRVMPADHGSGISQIQHKDIVPEPKQTARQYHSNNSKNVMPVPEQMAVREAHSVVGIPSDLGALPDQNNDLLTNKAPDLNTYLSTGEWIRQRLMKRFTGRTKASDNPGWLEVLAAGINRRPALDAKIVPDEKGQVAAVSFESKNFGFSRNFTHNSNK